MKKQNKLLAVLSMSALLAIGASMTAFAADGWVAIENEDAGDEDEPDYYWYYFQSNGKAYKRSDSASDESVSAKTINGKKYAFDEEGRMLYGWVSGGERRPLHRWMV